MKLATGFLCLLVLLTLAGCGGGSHDTPPPDSGGSPPAATAPAITAQPAAASVTAPATAIFSVTASGTAPLTYQWRGSTDGTTWTDVAGATGASYVTSATDVGMNGHYYSVVVGNGAGSVTSGSAQLTVIAASPPDSGGGDGGDGGGSGPSGVFPHAANPFAVAVTPADNAIAYFDAASSIDSTVHVPGGASDIVLADGVTVSFGVPGDTFLEDQGLAVTPVTLAPSDSEHPLPFQAVIGAFHIDPADTSIPELQTNNLVRVTFTFTQAALDVLGGQPVVFSARADGTQLHLVPVYANTDGTWSALTFTTAAGHLGIFGVATLNGAPADTLATAWPSYDDLQLEAALAPPSYEVRKAALAHPANALDGRERFKTNPAAAFSSDDDWFAQMQATLDAYYNDVVAPAVAAANAPGADLAQFRDATQKLLSWERQRQLLGIQEDIDNTVAEQISDFANRSLDIAMQDCTANRNSAALVQVLGLLRQAALLGVETDISMDSVMGACGHSTYDISIDWTQVHTTETDFDNPIPETAFAAKYRDSVTASGNLNKTDTTFEVTSTSFKQSLSYELTCAEGAWRCAYEKYSIIADDSDLKIVLCGSYSFNVSYRVDRWNLDARGRAATPSLYVTFQNSYGCSTTSFVLNADAVTKTSFDQNGNATSSNYASSDSVDTAPWSGSATLGTSSRIIRTSLPVTGLNVVPGATQRWTTSLKFKITEVVPPN